MKAKPLSAILTFIGLLFVQGLGLKVSHKNVTADTNRRILFGNPANVLDFPFLVGLRMRDGSVCAGSIIDEQWIMSAGHCLFSRPCNTIQVAAAVWTADESVYPIQCYTHPQYVKNLYPYDISLLKVQESLLRDGRASAIKLPPPGAHYPAGTPAVAVGWGITETGFYAGDLLQTNLIVEDWNPCNEKYKAHVLECRENPSCVGIPNRVLCTEGHTSIGPSGTCVGDSGGPIIINDFIAGIVSFGIIDEHKQCVIGTPAMHVNVADYLPWIFSHVHPDLDTSQIPVNPEY